MTNNDKELLLKDLSARLPYGVKLQHVKNADSIVELYSIDLDDFYCKIKFYTYKGKALTVSEEGKLLRPGGILRYKPYLFPLSSMTEELREEHKDLLDNQYSFDANGNIFTLQDFYCKYHFDYRGLIPMGSAIDCTTLNIY